MARDRLLGLVGVCAVGDDGAQGLVEVDTAANLVDRGPRLHDGTQLHVCDNAVSNLSSHPKTSEKSAICDSLD